MSLLAGQLKVHGEAQESWPSLSGLSFQRGSVSRRTGEALGGADDGPADGHRGPASAQPHGPEAGRDTGQPVSVCMCLRGRGARAGLFKRSSSGGAPSCAARSWGGHSRHIWKRAGQTSVPLSLT